MMGAKLVACAFTHYRHLPDRPFRLLVHMCLIAKDTDKRSKYFGGRSMLAESLGLDPDAPSSAPMVSRAIAALVADGAVDRANIGRVGQRAEYWLKVATPRIEGNSTVTQRVTLEANGRVTPESREGNSRVKKSVTPELPQGSTGGTTKEHREETTSSILTRSETGIRCLALWRPRLRERKGREATQSVFHLHLHVIPRAYEDGLALPWYSGKGGAWVNGADDDH